MPLRLKRCTGPTHPEDGVELSLDHFWKNAGAPDGRMNQCVECTKETRRQKAALRAQGKLQGQPDRAGRVLTDEERKRRSDDLKARHARGELDAAANGRKGGSSNYRTRIAQSVLARFREDDGLDLIITAYERSLRSKSVPQRLKAAEALVAMEAGDDKRQREDRGAGKRPEDLTPDELREVVRQGIEGMLLRGEINLSDLAGVIDLPEADVVLVSEDHAA